MLFFVATTSVCNLKCRYCQNEPDPFIEPFKPQFTINELKQFISKDTNPIIAFYGGEPLLNIEFIKKVIDEIPARKFVIQTNGLNLLRLDRYYLKKFDTILVSIDGRKETTDYYRGEGVYDKIMENIRYIRENGFQGDLIARMAVSHETDIFLDVMHLLKLKDPGFDHVHWQLDALWDIPPASRYGGIKGFENWVKNSYNPGITKLVNEWIKNMEGGKVLGIVPFLGIIKMLIWGSDGLLPCRSGIDAFAITTSGKILACPIAPEFEFNVVGEIKSSHPRKLLNSVPINGPCLDCEVKNICGGRCLFANKTMLWGERGFKLVCSTVKHLIDELVKVKDKIVEMLDEGIILKKDIYYPDYNNTTEIIP